MWQHIAFVTAAGASVDDDLLEGIACQASANIECMASPSSSVHDMDIAPDQHTDWTPVYEMIHQSIEVKVLAF